jgi:phospholipid-binding lipoprotein MlaA
MSGLDARGPVWAASRSFVHALLLCVLLPSAIAQAEQAADPSPIQVEAAPPEAMSAEDAAASADGGDRGVDALPTEPVSAPSQDSASERNLDALSAELDETGNTRPDPFETVNRHIFSFNTGVDIVLLDPLTRAYRFVLGDFARQSVRNLFANLNTPVILVNDLLQLEAKDAAITTTRFVLNSTMGMGGLFDPASSFGLEAHDSGFGETLEAAGLPSGPYLMMPLLGPTTVRDGFGNLVDVAMAPQSYILPVLGSIILTGSNGVVVREKHFEDMQALREQSVDYYASLRSAFFENLESRR